MAVLHALPAVRPAEWGFAITALYLLTPEQGEDVATVTGPHVLCDRCYKE